MTVLVDTSALYAALDADDQHHPSVRAAFGELATAGDDLVTHNYILLETVALAQRRLGLGAVAMLLDDLLPVMEVLWIDRATHEEACARLLAAGERRVSLVDWISFTTMRRGRIEVALAFDDHFREHGFRTIPG